MVITKSVKTYKSKKQLKSNKKINKTKSTIKKKFKKHGIERTYMQFTEIVILWKNTPSKISEH